MDDFDIQQNQQLQRQKMAQMLMQNAMQPAQGQMAGRVFVGNPSGAIGNVLQGYMGNKMGEDATKQLSSIAEQKRQRTADLLKQGFDALKAGDQQGAAQIMAQSEDTAPYAQELVKGQMAQLANQGKAEYKAPTTRSVRIGQEDVTQEYDPKAGKWNEVGRGPAWEPNSPAGVTAQDPSKGWEITKDAMGNLVRVNKLTGEGLPKSQPVGMGAPNAQGLKGDDFLKAIDPNQAAQVKALAEGRMPWPSGMALKTPYWQQMLSQVSQYDPTFDAVNYNARAKTRSDFTSGKNAQNIKSLNTAIGHLGTLNDQIGGTSSLEVPIVGQLLNKGINAAKEGSGDPGITNYNQTATALASELTQVFRGSGGAEADVKRYIDEMNANGSKAQKQAMIKNITDLLHSRISAIGDQYNQGMGTTEDPLTLLNPKAVGVLKKIEGGGQQATASPDDQAAIAWANANPNDPRAIKIKQLHGMQ